MNFVYIIKSQKTGKYYTGSTSDIEKRLQYHNKGANRSTKSGRPWELIYFEEYSDKSSALGREHQIKRYKGGEAFKKLLS